MTIEYTLTQLLMRFNHDELFYIIITFFFLKGSEGFQTEREGAVLIKQDNSDYTFIGDYRKKIEKYGIWERNLRYNKINRRSSSYIVFKININHFINIISQYSQELQLILYQEDKSSTQYLLYKNRLEQINSYINDKR
jgi:hypothetical protein